LEPRAEAQDLSQQGKALQLVHAQVENHHCEEHEPTTARAQKLCMPVATGPPRPCR
jgi:hypothetical protein